MFLHLLLAIPLVACGTTGGLTPMQQLSQRTVAAAAAANDAVINAQNTLRCPTGTRAVEHDVRITNDTDVEYREEHGRSGGRSSRGRLSGSYATYSGADVTVKANTEAESQGEIRCVSIIDLTPERR